MNEPTQDPFAQSHTFLIADYFRECQQVASKVNRDNGWWQEREQIRAILLLNGINNTPHMAIELLGLATSEIAEAMEAARKHPRPQWGDAETKDTMVREMAGCIVRLMDLAEHLQLPLGEAVIEEIRHNATRGFKHGGRAA